MKPASSFSTATSIRRRRRLQHPGHQCEFFVQFRRRAVFPDSTHTKIYELQNILTLTQGNHAIKVGGRLRQSDLTSYTNTNFNGTYIFWTPVAPASGPYCLAGMTNPTSLDLYQETETLLAQGVPMSKILAEGCGPTQFTLSSGIPQQTVRQLDLGLFAQDDWRLRPNLTISAGLRYETQNNIRDHLDPGAALCVGVGAGRKQHYAWRVENSDPRGLGNILHSLSQHGRAQCTAIQRGHADELPDHNNRGRSRGACPLRIDAGGDGGDPADFTADRGKPSDLSDRPESARSLYDADRQSEWNAHCPRAPRLR